MKRNGSRFAAMILTGAMAAAMAVPAVSYAGDTDKIKIEYWHCNSEEQGGKTVDELVQKFNESNDHIEVTAKYNPDMYKGLMQNLQAEAATGNYPAVVQIGWAFLDYFSNNFSYTSPQDAIDKFDSEDSTFLSDNFLPNVLNLAVNSKGDQVGIPYSLSNPVLYINKDLLKEAGVSEDGPATWEEVAQFAKAVKEKTGKYGFYMQEPADFWAQQALIESNGASMLTKDADGKAQASFASDEGAEAMQLVADMVKDGSALHVGWDEGCQSFIDGNCAMLYTTIARRASVQERRAMTRFRRHGNSRNTSTVLNQWQPGRSGPDMCRRERMSRMRRMA